MISNSDWVMFDLMSPQAFLRALMTVWARYTDDGKKPGAERWIFDDVEYGPQMYADVRNEWRNIVGGRVELTEDPSCFPYSLTFVRRAFLGVRKFDEQKKRKILDAFGIRCREMEKQESRQTEMFNG